LRGVVCYERTFLAEAVGFVVSAFGLIGNLCSLGGSPLRWTLTLESVFWVTQCGGLLLGNAAVGFAVSVASSVAVGLFMATAPQAIPS
jgi:hypothetical protein